MAYATLDGYDLFYVQEKEKFEKSNVPIMQVTTSSFRSVYTKPTLLFMYAPWCIHCKQFEPIYQDMANQFDQKAIPLQFSKVDCEANSAFIDEFGIRGFPTIILFTKNKKHHTYKGNRNLPELEKWIKEHIRDL